MKRTEFRKGMLVLLTGAPMATASLFAGDFPLAPGAAYARQAQGSRSASANHGGNQGITPAGGAAGASNPTPGGGPASMDAPGQTAGPGTTQSAPPGYVGEYLPPGGDGENPPQVVITTTRIEVPVNPGRQGMHDGFRDSTQRMTGANGERLSQAGILIHPDVEMAREVQALKLLLANLQEELQRQKVEKERAR